MYQLFSKKYIFNVQLTKKERKVENSNVKIQRKNEEGESRTQILKN